MSTLLDTCAISELYRAEPEPAVELAIDAIDALGEDTYISAVTISEMSMGAHSLPAGRRQRERLDQLAQTERRFAERTLDVDADIARLCGQIRARTRGVGIQIDLADGLIAATAIHHGMAVMTRNVSDFTPTDALDAQIGARLHGGEVTREECWRWFAARRMACRAARSLKPSASRATSPARSR